MLFRMYGSSEPHREWVECPTCGSIIAKPYLGRHEGKLSCQYVLQQKTLHNNGLEQTNGHHATIRAAGITVQKLPTVFHTNYSITRCWAPSWAVELASRFYFTPIQHLALHHANLQESRRRIILSVLALAGRSSVAEEIRKFGPCCDKGKVALGHLENMIRRDPTWLLRLDRK